MSFRDPASAEAAFYAAFGALDVEMMRGVWMDSPEVSCIHPGGGLLQGTAEVLRSWTEVFRDSQPPRITHRLLQSSSDQKLVVHTVEEMVNSGSGQRDVTILATNIYVHVDDGWRMLAHHASLPLVERRQPPLH
ncbi:MAG: nuclear transport factor 2 family protein [Sedimenticolaceae bacterium]